MTKQQVLLNNIIIELPVDGRFGLMVLTVQRSMTNGPIFSFVGLKSMSTGIYSYILLMPQSDHRTRTSVLYS